MEEYNGNIDQDEDEDEKREKRFSILSIILKAPLIILVLLSWGASFYAAIQKIQGITWAVPIIYTILVSLYIAGIYIQKQQ